MKATSLISVFIACLLLFQPANDISSQTGKKFPAQLSPRDNTEEIKKTNEQLDSSLLKLKQVEKNIDKVLNPRVVYRTRYIKSKPDTVYILPGELPNIPDFSFYKQDLHIDTVFVHDTITVPVKRKSWFKKLFTKK